MKQIRVSAVQGRQMDWQGDPGNSIAAYDEAILDQFAELKPWGQEASIDLFACDPVIIRDAEAIGTFAEALRDWLQMRRYGIPLLVHFGAQKRVSGYSLVQLFDETSAISAHFIEQANVVCLTIFSCAAFRPYAAARFCQLWFGAQQVSASAVLRGLVQQQRESASAQGAEEQQGGVEC